jgi:23S rRNA pseudouridine1911/1915/1917 synthase
MDEGEGKTAVTHYQTLEHLGTSHALVQLQPHTGRTHQLRVHMAAIGHPLVGDALYQMNDEAFMDWVENGRSTDQMPLLQRQALHSATTQFTHPVTEETCRLEAPLPADMVQLIETLR